MIGCVKDLTVITSIKCDISLQWLFLRSFHQITENNELRKMVNNWIRTLICCWKRLKSPHVKIALKNKTFSVIISIIDSRVSATPKVWVLIPHSRDYSPTGEVWMYGLPHVWMDWIQDKLLHTLANVYLPTCHLRTQLKKLSFYCKTFLSYELTIRLTQWVCVNFSN